MDERKDATMVLECKYFSNRLIVHRLTLVQACWSLDGGQIYAGRRNGTVDVWDVRLMGKNSMTEAPKLLKALRNPPSSGVVSCIAPLPDCRHLVW